MSDFLNLMGPEEIIWMAIAAIFDLTALVLTFIIGIGTIACLIMDGFFLLVIGAWMYFYSKSKVQRPERKTTKKAGEKKAVRTAEKEAAMETEKAIARTASRKIIRKISIRGIIAFSGTVLGALTIVIQFFPFWSWTVYKTVTEE